MADISKRTVLILLVLVIISTLISTWAFLSTVTQPTKVYVSSPGQSTAIGQVQLEIIQPTVTQASGEVSLEIIQPPGGQ